MAETENNSKTASSTTTPISLRVSGVSKLYGSRNALSNISFSAYRGELIAVIGPNGAGKTTLLQVIAGVLKPSSGHVNFTDPHAGWVPQEPALYRRLTVVENLRLFARLEKVPDPDSEVDEMLELSGLRDRLNDQVGTLSRGNIQRLNVALGVMRRRPVLLLDEPSAALDPRQRDRLWAFILKLSKDGATVIYSTHDIAEAERHSDRLLVVADGEALFFGPEEELQREIREREQAQAGTEAVRGLRADFESAFVRFLRDRGH